MQAGYIPDKQWSRSVSVPSENMCHYHDHHFLPGCCLSLKRLQSTVWETITDNDVETEIKWQVKEEAGSFFFLTGGRTVHRKICLYYVPRSAPRPSRVAANERHSYMCVCVCVTCNFIFWYPIPCPRNSKNPSMNFIWYRNVPHSLPLSEGSRNT